MIAHVKGIVAEKFNSSVIVDVHGLGYEIAVALADYERSLLGEEVKFYTHHHIREQSQELFGFTSLAAKKLFELLITVQGVGPKAALAILSLGESETVRNALANGDIAFITKASGVGKRIAERAVVDLKDKVGLPTTYTTTADLGSAPLITNDDALDALMALGFTLADATGALSAISAELPTAERVTRALRGGQ